MRILHGVMAMAAAMLVAACAHAPNADSLTLAPRDPAFDKQMVLESFDHALLSQAIFWETNRVRIGHGLPPLAALAALDAAADEQATYAALSLVAGHENPIPGEYDAGERTAKQGLEPKRVAENVIMMPAHRPQGEERQDYTYGEYAAFLLEGWMNSPGHRANILDQRFTSLGCAARPGHGFGTRDQRIFAVQVFILPYSGSGPLPVKP